MFEKIRAEFGPKLKGRLFGIWGISFKPATDDIREAPALVLMEKLISAGAQVCAYDPMAMPNAKRVLPTKWFSGKPLVLASDEYAAAMGTDALILVTEWESFRSPEFLKKSMSEALIVDARNQYRPDVVRAAGFRYIGMGR
jgi:UDPglucose 6-dehydrogenase